MPEKSIYPRFGEIADAGNPNDPVHLARHLTMQFSGVIFAQISEHSHEQ